VSTTTSRGHEDDDGPLVQALAEVLGTFDGDTYVIDVTFTDAGLFETRLDDGVLYLRLPRDRSR
jgi:hypothetical protein